MAINREKTLSAVKKKETERISSGRTAIAVNRQSETYNKLLKDEEERDSLMSYDLVSGENDIKSLETRLIGLKKEKTDYDTKYKANGGYIPSASNSVRPSYAQVEPYKEWSAKSVSYQREIDELEKSLAEKKTYYKRAKQLQTADNLYNAALNAEDFDTINGEGNEVTKQRAEYKSKYGNDFGADYQFGESTLTLEQRFAKYATDDEIDAYSYYIDKGDDESAQAYLMAMEETINARKGLGMYEDVEDHTALELAFGVAAGVQQFGVGVGNIFSDKDYYSPTATQVASQAVREDLADVGAKLPEFLGGNSLGQLGYDMINTTANMLPSILTSAAVTYATGGIATPAMASALGGAAGSITLGASASGNAYAEMINLGYDKGQAKTYAALVGGSEAGLQYLFGGVGKLGGKLTSKSIGTVVNNIDNAFAKGAIKFGGKMVSEGVEEYAQEILDPFFKNLAFNENNEINLFTPEALYSGVLGALSAGFLDGVPDVATSGINAVHTLNTGKTLTKNKNFDVSNLVELGNKMSADSVAYKIANKVNEKTGAYTIGKLFHSIGAELSVQNQQDIVKSLTRKGVAEKNANTIAEWLSATVNGAKLTKNQINALELNEDIADTFRDVVINKNSTFNQRRQALFEAGGIDTSAGIDVNSIAEQNTPDAVINRINETQMLTTQSAPSLETQLAQLAQATVTGKDVAPATETRSDAFIPLAKQTAPVRGTSKIKALDSITAQEYDVSSVEGKTILKSTNEDVDIKKIASVEGNSMNLELTDGRIVSSKDVSYGTQGEALVYETVANMNVPVDVANNLVSMYDPNSGQSAVAFAKGIEEAYRYGYFSIPKAEMSARASFTSELTPKQREDAYKLGHIMGADRAKTASKNVTEGKSGAIGKGKVHFNGSRNGLSKRQKASLDALEVIAEVTGLQVEVFESKLNEKGNRVGENGSYDPKTGKMRIDLYAGIDGNGLMLFTASHELVHHIKNWSPAKFKTLADFLMEQYGEKGVSVDTLVKRQIAKAAARDRKLTYEEAYEEVIADSMESMLADGAVVEKLKLLSMKDKSLVSKIKNFLDNLVSKIKQTYKGLKPDSAEGKMVAEMVDATEKLQNLFAEALMDATESYQSAESADKTPTSNFDVRYSERYQSADTNTDILSMVEKVENGNFKPNEKVMLGTVSDATAAEIYKITGINATGFSVAIEARQISHILIGHGKNGNRDRSMADPSDIAKIEFALEEYDDIRAAGKTQAYTHMVNGKNRTADTVLYEKSIGEKSYYVVQAVPDTKAKTLYIVTAFIGKKGYKKETSQLINANRLDVTSEIGSADVSIDSISDSTAKSQEKLSDRDADYMSAVESGDMKTAQKMVDEAAKTAKYSSPMLYHGTQSFGFTEFDLSRMDDKRSIFLTSSNKIASTYSGVSGTRKVFTQYSKDIDSMKLESVVEELNALSDEYYKGALDYRKYTHIDTQYSNELISAVNNGIEALRENVLSILNQHKGDGKIYQQLFALEKKLERYEYQNLSTPIYMLLHHTNVFAENGKEIAELEKNIRILNEIRFLDIFEGFVVREMLDGYSLDLLNEAEAKDELKYLCSKGNYSMYAKSNNPLVIDGKGQLWRDIRNWHESVYYQKENTEVGENDEFYCLIDKRTGEELELGGIMKNAFSQGMTKTELHNFMLNKANQMLRIQTEGIYTTREIAKFAKERGYDSVAFKNILDNGGMNSDVEMNETADIYVYFSPNQIKSADPVTYDDNGNVIPLSKRFDSSESDFRYSDRDPDSISTRNLLANALEGTIKNDVERKRLAEYKGKIDRMNAEEAKLSELRKQIKEASFSKGKRDSAKLKQLKEDATKTANRIANYDRQLLNLESTQALKNVLEREKKKATERQKQKDKEILADYKKRAEQKQQDIIDRYQESRKKATEGRHKTEMRNKIKKVVSELNQYLLHGTKDKHVMIGMQKAVAEALSIVNMDTVGADDRVARYDALIAEATDPDVIESLTASRDRIKGQGDRLSEKLTSLQTAYSSIKDSSDPLVSNAYDEVIEAKIASVADTVGDAPLRDMSMSQLEEVYDLYKMVLTNIRKANKLFAAEKQETVEELGFMVDGEVKEVTKHKDRMLAINSFARKMGYKELKPIYFFRMLGSDTMSSLYKGIRDGQNTWYTDAKEAKAFRLQTEKDHNYKNWDFDKKHTFTAKSGKTFDLTLSQIMSIYAFSRREQALDHLIKGGIVFDDSVKIKDKAKKTGIPLSYTVNTSDAFNLSEFTLGEIIATLTAEQKAFVETMQAYLSDTMGEKGNEVSLELYGVKMFKEKNYFPLKSSQYYMAFTAEEAGEVKIKNSSFSKEAVKHANNPIVLSDFMDVWTSHVNDMAMYHAFVLPLEDFTRVYNYRTPTGDNFETTSIKSTIHNHFTESANEYIRQLLKDINGGSVSGVGTQLIDKMIGLAKKGAVFASASVVVQQPSAIARAMAYVNPKYFANVSAFNFAKHNRLWEECKRYAPIAGIKEMGYFDTSVGQTGIDWIKSDEYDSIREKLFAFIKDKEQRRTILDDALSKAPAMADELSWVALWEAIKKETKKTTDLKVGSEEFFKHCGERFTEVVDLTQVYDSVFSRSELMRSKDRMVKAATAFMAEPTTQVNMLFDAGLQLKRKGKAAIGVAASVTASVVASMVVNSLLKSVVLAGRDDDEDETYLEKYAASFTGDVLNGMNPLTLIPFVKDVISIIQGYSVDRMDMSVIDDLVTSVFDLGKDTKTDYEKWTGLLGSVGQLFGVPAKNILRDVNAAVNTFNTLTNGSATTKSGLKSSVKEGLSGTVTAILVDTITGMGFDTSKGKQYYDAVMSGDTEHVKRLATSYGDAKKADAAIVKALKDFEPRVTEAAKAQINGDNATRIRISKEIIADGFSQDYVVKAINSAINALDKDESKEYSLKAQSLYSKDDYFDAAYNGDTPNANLYKEELMRVDIENNGKTEEEAESNFNSSFRSLVKKAVIEGTITIDKATRMLADFGGLGEEKAYENAQYYDFIGQHPNLEYGWQASTVASYLEKAEPAGISVEVYDNYLVQKSKCKGIDRNKDGKADSGTRKAQIYRVINSLPITAKQKALLRQMN